MMTVAEAELVRRAQEKGRSASFCAPSQLAAAAGALSKAHSSLDLQQMDGTAAAACLNAAQHTPGAPQRLLKVAQASKRSQSCRVSGSARPPRVKRRESSTRDLNVGINAVEEADISTVAAAFFADDGDQSLPYNPFLRKVPSCGRLVTLTADGAGTGSGEDLAEDSPILRRSASARRPRPFESPQHSPTPTRVTRASQKGRGTVKKAPGARNRTGAASGGTGYLDVKPSCSNEVLDRDAYLLRNFSTTHKGLVNRGDSFRRRRSRSNSIQPPIDSRDSQILPPQPSTSQPHTPPVTTPTDSTVVTPQQLLTPGAGSPEGVRSFRVAIIGAQGVGKTALITQFQSSECINAYDVNPTDETEFTVSILLNNIESEMVLVNVATATEFQRETQRAEEPDAWVVLYSITDKASFGRASEDLCKLQSFGLLRGHALILVANKCELVRSRAVSVDDGRDLACSYGGKFMEISVGMNHRCDELLVGILNQCRIKEEQDESEEEPKEKEKTWTRNRSLMRASMKAKRVINKIMGKTDTKYKNCEDFDT